MNDDHDDAGDNQEWIRRLDEFPDQQGDETKADAPADHLARLDASPHVLLATAVNVNPLVASGVDVTSSSEHAFPFGEVVKRQGPVPGVERPGLG